MAGVEFPFKTSCSLALENKAVKQVIITRSGLGWSKNGCMECSLELSKMFRNY